MTAQPSENSEAVASDEVEVVESDPESGEAIDRPAKVMRIGTMMKQLLEELRSTELDEPSRDRLRDIYEISIGELGSALSVDLRDELDRLALPFSSDAVPTAAELQIAKAQLVGWLEGLIQGIQAALFAQQMAARQQLESMRTQIGHGRSSSDAEGRPGTYL